MADLTKYSKGKRMVFEQDIKQIAENTKEIVDLKEDLQGKVNSYVVTDIKALTSDFINKLKSGDVVVKQTGSGQHPQYHSYRVSFMKDNEGMCLTYTDASCSETVSYDKSGNNWVYNSTDLTQFDKIVEVIELQGTEEQATGLKINGVDYKVGGGAELYLHTFCWYASSSAFNTIIKIQILNTSATPLTGVNIRTYLTENGFTSRTKYYPCSATQPGLTSTHTNNIPQYVGLYMNGTTLKIIGYTTKVYQDANMLVTNFEYQESISDLPYTTNQEDIVIKVM